MAYPPGTTYDHLKRAGIIRTCSKCDIELDFYTDVELESGEYCVYCAIEEYILKSSRYTDAIDDILSKAEKVSSGMVDRDLVTKIGFQVRDLQQDLDCLVETVEHLLHLKEREKRLGRT